MKQIGITTALDAVRVPDSNRATITIRSGFDDPNRDEAIIFESFVVAPPARAILLILIRIDNQIDAKRVGIRQPFEIELKPERIGCCVVII